MVDADGVVVGCIVVSHGAMEKIAAILMIGRVDLLSDFDVGRKCTSPSLMSRNALIKSLCLRARFTIVVVSSRDSFMLKVRVNSRCFSSAGAVTLDPWMILFSFMVGMVFFSSWDGCSL